MFMFGTIYGLAVRVVGRPIRSFSIHNRPVPITNNMALYGIIFVLIFMPAISSGFAGFSNTLFCQIFAIIGYLLVELNRINQIRLQRVFETAISAAMLMSVGATFFQNLLAPTIIGLAFGIINGFFGEQFHKFFISKTRLPDPARTYSLIFIPVVLGTIFTSIGIAAYKIKSTNKLGILFPYIDILK